MDVATIHACLHCHQQDLLDLPVEEKGSIALGLSPSLSLSIMYPRSVPWPIEGKARRPIRGSFFDHKKHFNSTSLSPETWELIPLLIVCKPYYRLK
jgi:hypothetical protein